MSEVEIRLIELLTESELNKNSRFGLYHVSKLFPAHLIQRWGRAREWGNGSATLTYVIAISPVRDYFITTITTIIIITLKSSFRLSMNRMQQLDENSFEFKISIMPKLLEGLID